MAGDFSDEEWDLSDDELQVLENRAITATQQQALQDAAVTRGSRLRADGFDLSKTQRLSTSSIASAARNQNAQSRPQGLQQLTQEDSFATISIDEDGIPLILEEKKQAPSKARPADETTAREQFRANRFADRKPAPQPAYRRPVYGNYIPPVQAVSNGANASFSSQSFQAPQKDEATAIRRELEELKKEREQLAKNLDTATDELRTARGENAIIRDNLNKETISHERQLAVQRKQKEEDAHHQRVAAQAKEAAYNQLVTEKNYMKHELDELTRKNASLARQLKDAPQQNQQNEVSMSPRKHLAHSLRDGFDDGDMMQPVSPHKSPSRTGRRSKPGTPNNRKRKQSSLNDSMPALPLRLASTVGSDEGITLADEPAISKPKAADVQAKKEQIATNNLRFIQKVLNFRPSDGQTTLIERAVDMAFPTNKARPLSSILLSDTSTLSGDTIPADLFQIVTKLIVQCHKEKYHKPVALLLALLDHILDLEPLCLTADMIKAILPALQDLAYINAQTRWKLNDRAKLWEAKQAAASAAKSGLPKEPPPRNNLEVSTTACLDLLLTIANLSHDEPELIEVFWRCMDTDFVLLSLTSSQNITDIALMLSLLDTSITPTTFGSICQPDQQTQMEIYILDKAAFLLWDTPKSIHNPASLFTEQSNTPIQICHFRLEVLAFISRVCVTSSYPHPHTHTTPHHGASFIAHTHPNALARLVRCIYDSLSQLYRTSPQHALHALYTRLINTAMAILHHVLIAYPQSLDQTSTTAAIDLPKKLAGTPVGMHKFRVAMTRLAFGGASEMGSSQGKPMVNASVAVLGLDAGITERTREMAEEILGEYVNPDEALGLIEAFGRVGVDDADDDDEDGTMPAEVMDVDGDQDETMRDDSADAGAEAEAMET